MQDVLERGPYYLWLAVGFVWLAGAITAKRTERTQTSASRLRHLALEVLAFFLVFGRFPWPAWLHSRFVPEASIAAEWIALALTAGGIAFAIAARFWIGRNWSGRVTIKEQHELIQDGPYSVVRHPIYLGFLLALLGTAMVLGRGARPDRLGAGGPRVDLQAAHRRSVSGAAVRPSLS